MKKKVLYTLCASPGGQYAARFLAGMGVSVREEPGEEPGALLLDVPSYSPDGALRCGLEADAIFRRYPGVCLVFGGNLKSGFPEHIRTVDLLQEENYLAHNAAITAHCTLKLLLEKLSVTLPREKILIIGWGRIGKCLGRLLKNLDAEITFAVRSADTAAVLRAMGFEADRLERIDLSPFRAVINTAPAPQLGPEQLADCSRAVQLDLASRRGLMGPDVIWARGLPGIHAPESAGKLIAETVMKLWREEPL